MSTKLKYFGAAAIGLYILNKLRLKYEYNLKLQDGFGINNKIVLITGCDSGLGHSMAMELNKSGYRIFATCLKQEAVDTFNSKKAFTNNGSIAYKMDVTNFNDINNVKQELIKYLDSNKNTIFWSIINNAGYYIPASFELVPISMDMHNRNVLYLAPINIIKIFLPLMYGRKQYVKYKENRLNEANGGRIMNITSGSVNFPLKLGQSYSSSKAGLAFFSKSLNMELSPKFGIWVISIESGAYKTNIYQTSANILDEIEKKYVEESEKNQYYAELLRIYDMKQEKLNWKNREEKSIPKIAITPIDVFIDDIKHGLDAKYPKRVYYPGWGYIFNILQYLPLSTLAKM